MALSGSFGNTWRKNYRVQLDWTATQNIANNTTTVTAKIYLVSLSSTATITGSSSNKPAYISIDGTEYVHENLNTNLSGNQKKLMATSVKTVTHNADGTKSIQIGGSVNVQATLSGVYWYNVAVPTTTVTLNTIPRASTISSFPSFTIGNSFTVKVSRASTAFTHTLMLYHGSTKVGEWTGVTTSKAITLTTTQLNTLYGLVPTSATLTMRCYTYNGTTAIGSYTTATATATVANASTISTFGSFTIGNDIAVTLSRSLSAFTHTIMLYVGSTKVCERTGIATSTTLTLSTAEQNIIYTALKNANSGTVTLRCYTYHGANSVRSYKTKTATATVASTLKPTFTSITAAETVSAVSALGIYIQNLSRIKFTINGANGVKYSTIKSYKIVFNGVTYNNSTATTGAISKSGNITATATITDSRGRTASKTLVVNLVAYSPPKLTSVSAVRVTGTTPDPLGTSIRIISAGSVSSLSSKNTMTYKILTKTKTSSTWTSKRSSSLTIPTLSQTNSYSGYAITNSYDVRIQLIDKFSTTTHNVSVSTGEVAMSWGKTGIGVGKIWEQGALDVGGDAYFRDTANIDTIRQMNFFKTVIQLSGAPSASGPGRWFISLTNNSSNIFFGGSIRLSGSYSHAPIMGILEKTFGFYLSSGSSSMSMLESRVTVGVGAVATNMRISDPVVVNGRMGFYIYSSNTNSPYVQIDAYVSRTPDVQVGSWEAASMPAREYMDADTLGGYTASQFSLSSHAHAWSTITSKPSTFAPSSHNHSGANITSGTVPYARLPVGTGSSQVSRGNHTHSYLPTSYVKTGTCKIYSGGWRSFSFGVTMPSVPRVFLTSQDGINSISNGKVRNITKTGFEAIIGGTYNESTHNYLAICGQG